MRKKLTITLFIIIIMIQTMMPIIVHANNSTAKESIFSSNITFSWEVVPQEGNVMEYGIYKPSNANEYEKIPLIVWLHGLGQQGGNANEIRTASDGFPKAIEESKLEKFSAYVVCPHIPVYNEQRFILDRKPDGSIT